MTDQTAAAPEPGIPDAPDADRSAPDLPDSVLAALGPPSSDGPAASAVHEVLALTMDDGTVLRADVVRPADALPHPVLLTRGPYFGSWREAFGPLLAPGGRPDAPGTMAGVVGLQTAVGLDRAVAEGFAVVAQACRGTDASEGAFRFHADEAADGVATRRALAALAWCDGRVLTFGQSYLSTTQFTAALASTEHLAAMAPWVAPSTYDDDLAARGGVFLAGPSYEWARQQVGAGRAHDGLADVPAERLPKVVEEFGPFLARVGSGAAARELARAHSAGAHMADWVAHPLRDEYWESVSYPREGLAALDVPTLHLAGWYDLFLGGTLRNYEVMAVGAAGDRQRLVVGPWTHLTFDGRLEGRSFPGGGTAESGLGDLTMDFWKAALGDPAASARLPRDPVRVYVMGADRWVDLPAWPSPDAADTVWRLSDGALLAPADPAPAVGRSSWIHDPAAPVPTAGGQMLMGPPENAGPHDQRDVEGRRDVVVLTSPVLAEPVTVLGPVRLHAWVGADATDVHLHATLTDVFPDGTSTILTDGVLRLSAHRGTDRRDPLPVGEPVEVEVDMWATGVHLPAGHRIRLDLAGSNWPRYAVADPDGGRPVRITVWHDVEHPSALHLPVVDLDAVVARTEGVSRGES